VINLKDIVYALTNHSLPLEVCEARFNHAISSVTIDSRQAEAGSLFIALPGERVDGHDYIKAAFDNGAILALTGKEPPENFNTLDLRLNPFNLQQIIETKTNRYHSSSLFKSAGFPVSPSHHSHGLA